MSSKGELITKEVYDACVAMGKKQSTDAFMGRLRGTYYTFERYITKKGWREHLLELVKNYEVDSLHI